MSNGEAFLLGAVVSGLVLSAIAALITEDSCRTYWQKQAVAHKAAEYVVTERGVEFKWKDEVQNDK